MKKIGFICLLIFTFSIIGLAFGSKYTQVPKKINPNFKIEAETYINEQTKISKNDIDKNVEDIYNLYQKILNDKNKKYHSEQYIYDFEDMERGLFDPAFYLYNGLIDITAKYVDIKNDVPTTDFYITLVEFINPYLENNNIDTKKLYEFNIYCNEQEKKVKQYSQEIHKILK